MVSWIDMRKITFTEAIREALWEEMVKDWRVYLIGEDIVTYHNGGPFRICEGFLEEFGPTRVIETPISETAIMGTSVGAAMMGFKPVVEIMHSEFLASCFQHLAYEAPRMKFVTRGEVDVPLVVRAPFGVKGEIGQTQSESPESWFVHIPGLKVVMPSTPYDAKGLLKSAIRDRSPVVFFEHKKLYRFQGPVPQDEYTIPIGKAKVKREGTDMSIIATGYMVHLALGAAVDLSQSGIDVEVIDPLTLLPLDRDTVINSIAKTGRAMIVHEASRTGGFGAEVAALLAEEAFEDLRAPILRVASPDVPVRYPPTKEDIQAAARRLMEYA
jgi:pyruvate/2-oxoglutarate/acetoin dehydrogenase E1 component